MSEQPEDIAHPAVELPVKRVTGDTLKTRLTANAFYNILPDRYLQQDETGTVVEEPTELFERVAQNLALADVVYKTHDLTPIRVKPTQIKPTATESRRNELCTEVFGDNISLDDDITAELAEDTVYAFAWETVVPDLPESVRTHVEQVESEFESLLTELGFMVSGPTLMNAGGELQQLSAGFVNSPTDDVQNIHQTAEEAALISQGGGGLGYSFSDLRPYGDPAGTTGEMASGPIPVMRMYDQMCQTISHGGKRRDAQMAVLNVEHPDIIQFIHAKDEDVSLAESLRLDDPDDYTHNSFGDAIEQARELLVEDDDGVPRVPSELEHLRNAADGQLSNFNISVGVTEAFMDAVKNDELFTLKSPRTDEPHIATEETEQMYSWFGLEDAVTVGEPLEIPARELWDRMSRGAWENGEPGLVFLDKINEQHSFDVAEHPEYTINSTSLSGEQPLMDYESCTLGHINLSTVVDKTTPDWRDIDDDAIESDAELHDAVEEFLDEAIDWGILDRRINCGTHMLENVVTMSDSPVQESIDTARDNRKIGLGIMGLAQMYVQMGVRYGSPVGDEIARQILTYIDTESRHTSHNIATGKAGFAKRGTFVNWDDSKYAMPADYAEWFESMTGEDASEWADGYPMRNHDTTTIAPCTTPSTISNTTRGCEPISQVASYTTVSGDVQGDEMLVEFDDYFLRTLEANDIDVSAVKAEAERQMSRNDFDGVNTLDAVPDRIGELFVTAGELSAKQHASVQCALQEGVGSAISKMVNAPATASVADTADAFMYVYENGGKAVSYHRDGTHANQVVTTRADTQESDDPVDTVREMLESGDISREDLGVEYPFSEPLNTNSTSDDPVSEVKQLVEDGEVTPHELGIDANPDYRTPRDRPKNIRGGTEKLNTGYGDLFVTVNADTQGPFEVFANIGKSGGYTESFTEATARLISLALRSGIKPEAVIKQIEGIRSPRVSWDEGEKVHSVPDGIGKAIKRHTGHDQPAETTEGVSHQPTEANAEPTPNEQFSPQVDSTDVVQSGENPECPECRSLSLSYADGSKSCELCGWSAQ